MAALMPQGKQQYFTAGGIPLVGGKVYTYAAGTTTPLATYTTAAASTPNANPVILDSRGEASIFFSAANYKIVVKDSLDSTIWTVDNLAGDAAATIVANLAASSGSSLVGYMPDGTDALPTTLQSKLRKSVSVLDFGVNTTPGTTNMTSAFTKAIAYAVNSGASIHIPSGIYLVDEVALTNGAPVGNGNKYGQSFYGDGVGKTILKFTGTSDKCLSFLGSPGNYFYVNFKADDFSIDMSLMPNASTSIGIYGIYAYGGALRNVNVINQPASAFALYLDQGCYTTVWNNCDFGGETGRIKIQGVGSQSVTTQTFIGSSFGQLVSDNASANSFLSCIVQGALTPKFQLSEQYGLTINGCDMEGTGVLYAFGANCGQVASINNALVGFSGTYSTGSIASGMLMDQVYPVTTTGQPHVINNIAVTTTAVAEGNTVALKLNGTVLEEVINSGLTRKTIKNSSGVANRVDIQLINSSGASYFGIDSTGRTFLEGGNEKSIALRVSGSDKFGVAETGHLLCNTYTTTNVGSAGAASALPATPTGYIGIYIAGVFQRIPYYN